MANQGHNDSEDFKFLKDILASKNTFWKETYPNLTVAERKKVWHQDVYYGMRRQPEETQDMYDAFSKEWYEFANKTEPDFDMFFEEIIADLGGYLLEPFDWEKYRKRILK